MTKDERIEQLEKLLHSAHLRNERVERKAAAANKALLEYREEYRRLSRENTLSKERLANGGESFRLLQEMEARFVHIQQLVTLPMGVNKITKQHCYGPGTENWTPESFPSDLR